MKQRRFKIEFKDGRAVYKFNATDKIARRQAIGDVRKHFGRKCARSLAVKLLNSAFKVRMSMEVIFSGSGRPGIELWDSSCELRRFMDVCRGRDFKEYVASAVDITRSDSQIEAEKSWAKWLREQDEKDGVVFAAEGSSLTLNEKRRK